ncbi:hypothetical protein XA68_16077 [Ophiocordyceps unilateralis]|uniref:ORC6 first cyclin-like domain-containing protein n=1 Tax=Ophiocordyceps unilateralis TaxID=268505 RepID=A0A2A9PM07_OPHUN|nr:hypothetical protein XA68_16077 [Ophiocordyceps unilateralis]
MDRQIEHALLSLMPAHGPNLAPSLVELASSLLAQSRNRASALKADEEVARPYACANIACERLKTVLDLPPIEPRPPIPPRLYKRLYTHLDNILPKSSRGPASTRLTPRSPASRRLQRPEPVSASPRPRGTPIKERVLTGTRTPTSKASAGDGASQTPTNSKRRKRAGDDDDGVVASGLLYHWVVPVVRFLCAESGVEKFVPTLLAGVAFAQQQQDPETQVDWARQHAVSLVAALFFNVVVRLRALYSPSEPVDGEGCKKGIVTQLGLARTEVQTRRLPEADFWHGWKTLQAEEFDAALARVKDENWLDGDWFRGIADVVGSKTAADLPAGLEGQDAGLARRADTMFQDKYDFLSPRRRADYKVWRSKMLAKMDAAMGVVGKAPKETKTR